MKNPKSTNPSILLSVAGFDPSGGAGVLLDLKVFHYFNFLGQAVLTSLTAQNTMEVTSIHSLSASFIQEQYEALKKDFIFHGLKIGLLSSPEHAEVVHSILTEMATIPRVVDPVFKSSSGRTFWPTQYLKDYIAKIIPLASLITPNLEEAEILVGYSITSPAEMEKAAQEIVRLGAKTCLLKGGHLCDSPVDILFDGYQVYRFPHQKIPFSTHGTGCLLSSSLLALIAQGNNLPEATQKAIDFTQRQILSSLPWGRGPRIIWLKE